jgi:hypothetical protein
LQGALTHALRVEKKTLEARLWPLESQNKSEQKIDMHLHQLEDKLGRKTIHLIANWEQGVCHTVALPFTLKSIWMQKKNYENSNISPRKI